MGTGKDDDTSARLSFLNKFKKFGRTDSTDYNSSRTKQANNSFVSIGNTITNVNHSHNDELGSTTMIAGAAVVVLVAIAAAAYYKNPVAGGNGRDGDGGPGPSEATVTTVHEQSEVTEESKEDEVVVKTAEFTTEGGVVSIREETKTTSHRKVMISKQSVQSAPIQGTATTVLTTSFRDDDEELRARLLGNLRRVKKLGSP